MRTIWGSLCALTVFLGCSSQISDSKMNFASEHLGKFNDDFFDVKLKPKPMRGSGLNSSRSLDLSQHLFEMRFFRVIYKNQVPLDQPLEGDVVRFEDLGGSMITVDKFSDPMIEITTALPNRKKIPDGHYAAVICPVSTSRTKNCLVDPDPLSKYKNEVQSGRCGKITANGDSLDDKCKKVLFTGNNTFTAIAYPLTAQNNRFISGDKEFSYVKNTQLSLGQDSPDLNPECLNNVKKMQANAISEDAFKHICKNDQPPPAPAAPKPPAPAAPTPPATDINNVGGKPTPPATDMGNSGGKPSAPKPPPPAPPPPVARPPQAPPSFPNPVPPPMVPPPPPFAPMGPQPGGFVPNGMQPMNFPPNFAGMPPDWAMGGMGSDCFMAGTKIVGVRAKDFQGSHSKLIDIEIQSFKEGDWVFNPLTNGLYRVTGLNIAHFGKGKMVYEIGGSALKVTGVHPVIRQKGYDMIAAVFKGTDDSVQSDHLLYSADDRLTFRTIQVSKRPLDADTQVFNVFTESSTEVLLASSSADRSALPDKFSCSEAKNQTCLNFLAVRDGTRGLLVAGDFIKQQELHRSFAYFSSATYQSSLGE